MKEFKYLGYIIQRNGDQEAQVRERMAKAAVIMGQVWGIGKRRFEEDWKRRIWIFDTLDSDEIRSGDMGMERKEGVGKDT